MIRVLALADVMGRPGRRVLDRLLPPAREEFAPDIVIANGENAAGGFGLTPKICRQFIDQFGIDCVTSGNHWRDKPDIYKILGREPRVIIPANAPGAAERHPGYTVLQTRAGISFAVINLLGRVFMNEETGDPFAAADRILEAIDPAIKIRIVDFHGEASSEKQAMGRHLCGRASLVYGSHWHVQSADERILDRRTGFITDAGMSGPYDSVIGVETSASLSRFRGESPRRFEPAKNDLWMCFIIAHLDETDGHCRQIERHRWELDRFSPKG